MTLSAKRLLFCQEYVIDFVGAKAAIRAKYSAKAARQTAHKLLQNPEVQEEIDRLKAEREARTEITVDRTLKEYARIAYLDPRKFFNEDGTPKAIVDLDDDTAAALAGMDIQEKFVGTNEEPVLLRTKKVKIADKLKALDSIGKHLGIFEKHNRQQAVNIFPPAVDKPEESGK